MDKEITPKSVHAANVAQGFYDTQRSVLEKMENNDIHFTEEEIDAVKIAFQMQRLMLMVSELGEACEALRKGKTTSLMNNPFNVVSDLDPNSEYDVKYYAEHFKDTAEDEKADTLIRLYDDAGRVGYDLEAHVRMKLAYNATRPFRHGGKKC